MLTAVSRDRQGRQVKEVAPDASVGQAKCTLQTSRFFQAQKKRELPIGWAEGTSPQQVRSDIHLPSSAVA